MVRAPDVIDAPERGDGDEAAAAEDDASGNSWRRDSRRRDSSGTSPEQLRGVRDGFDRLEHWIGAGDPRGVRRLHLHPTRAVARPAQHHDHGWRHRRPRLVPRFPDRPLPAVAGGGLVERLLRRVPGGTVLLPVPRGADRAARRRPAVQRRVQARHRRRSAPVASGRVRLRRVASARRVPRRPCSQSRPPASCSSRVAATRP